MTAIQVPRELPTVQRGDRGLPFFGRLAAYTRDPVALMQHQWQTYGPVSPFPFLGQTHVMLLGPQACEEALRNGEKALANGPAWGQLVGPFFHRGLMLLDGKEHHLHRRIMQEAFTRHRLNTYVEAMHPAIARGIDTWQPASDFRSYPALKQLTLDVAADIFMGGAAQTSQTEMDRVNRAFVACVQAASGIVRANVPFTRWGRAYRGRAVLEDFLRQYLPAKRAEQSDDLFSVLCHIETDTGERFSDDDVIDHMVFLMMAAHDTSTITTSTVLQYLGQFPHWQERCRDESMALSEAPTLAELEQLTSLDLVIKEALRLRAPVPVLMRQAVRETTIQGVRIPEGSNVIVGVQFSHLMPQLWTEPTRFDPERFNADRREDKTHRYAWSPFGGGVHKCIGLHFAGAEVKAMVHRLLRTHRWTVDPTYTAPLDHHSLPFPKDGQPIDLTRLPEASL
ncbi:MAG: cytochrome P450 [Nocardioidaceae bacterium]|nr:cytochrome P450 [Nocardioidaceae bacterium]